MSLIKDGEHLCSRAALRGRGPDGSQQRERRAHPLRVFYVLIVTVVGALIVNFVYQLAIDQSTLTHPEKWPIWQAIMRAYQANHVVFVVVVAMLVTAFAVGWWVDAHPPAETTYHDLPFVRDLRPVSFKLGDDAAASGPYIVAPVRESYDAALSALREASARAPQAKNGVLVMGVATAGKTRLAFEVVRAALADWRVLIWRPDDRIGLSPAASHGASAPVVRRVG